MIKLGYCYDHLDKRHQFYIDCGVPSCYTQWVFYGIGQTMQDKKADLYPFYPNWKSITTIKEYIGNSGKDYTWYGRQIGKIILKKLELIKKSKKK